MCRQYPALEIVNEEEEERLQDVLERKRRGKGAPKKAKSAGITNSSSRQLDLLIIGFHPQRTAEDWARNGETYQSHNSFSSVFRFCLATPFRLTWQSNTHAFIILFCPKSTTEKCASPDLIVLSLSSSRMLSLALDYRFRLCTTAPAKVFST